MIVETKFNIGDHVLSKDGPMTIYNIKIEVISYTDGPRARISYEGMDRSYDESDLKKLEIVNN